MKVAVCTLKNQSGSPYNQSRQHFAPKEEKETHEDYEKRTWKEKAYYDDQDIAYIPPMALKGAVASAAKLLAIPIPGKGKNLYTKHFLSGVMVTDGLSLGVSKSEVQSQEVSCDPQGRKGGMGVIRRFPHFKQWEGTVRFQILDDTITREVFERVLKEAGNFIGIGQFRPEKGGYFGRFEVAAIEWE